MKNTIKQFLFSAMAVLFACSFQASDASPSGMNANATTINELPLGGAYLKLAGKFGGNISKKELQGPCKITVDGCATGSRIFQFTLVVTQKGKKTTFETQSGSLNKDMMAKLQSLSAGDEFEFKGIKAYLPNGKDVVDVHSEKFVVV
jgi:hypothetical protein